MPTVYRRCAHGTVERETAQVLKCNKRGDRGGGVRTPLLVAAGTTPGASVGLYFSSSLFIIIIVVITVVLVVIVSFAALVFVDLNVSAAEITLLGRAARDGNGEPVV